MRNFYRRSQQVYKVKRTRMKWHPADGSDTSMDLLPEMQTDATLIGSDRVIVIETKFVPSALSAYHGKQSLRSAHLYQLFAYLRNFPAHVRGRRSLEGLLLYPEAGCKLDHCLTIHGHTVRICTVDLDRRWQEIQNALWELVEAMPQLPVPYGLAINDLPTSVR